MSSSAVFDDIDRIDRSPASHVESSSHFLNRVTGRYWDQVRSLVEDWVAHLPMDGRTDMVGRLRAQDNRQSSAAFWELYLHESFLRAGYEVRIHPTPPGGRRPPDFLVSKGDDHFYVEATAVFGSSNYGGEGARKRQLYDEINRIESPNFFVDLDTKAVGPEALPTSQLKRDLRTWLDGLDPDQVTFDRVHGDKFVWRNRGWELEFRPLPIRKDRRGSPDHRVIGMYGPPEAKWIDDATTLRDALKDKGSAYGALDHPLVIAVNVATAFHDDEDTMNALYGSLGLQVAVGNSDTPDRYVRASDGYWGAPPTWSHTHVVGLLLGHNVSPWNVARSAPCLWAHPASPTPISTSPVCSRAYLDEDHIERADATTPAWNYFDLPEDWPEGEPFPERHQVRPPPAPTSAPDSKRLQ